MSEKRFFKSHYTEHIIDKANDKCYPIRNVMGVDDLVDLLNSLSEENEQLKQSNETLKSNYQREIQSSIDFCNAYSKTNGELLEEIEKLAKENEQLKKKYDNLNSAIEKTAMDMNEKRFIVPKQKDEEFYWNIIDTEKGKVVLQHISLFATTEICFLLNELDYQCIILLEQKEHWKDTCKHLEQQHLNLINAIVKTCNDLNNTEEVYLGDFDICKRITEYEKELSGDGV